MASGALVFWKHVFVFVYYCVCVCTYTCIYTHIHTHTHACTHTLRHTYIHCMHIHTAYACTEAHKTHVNACMHTGEEFFMQFSHTHTHTHIWKRFSIELKHTCIFLHVYISVMCTKVHIMRISIIRTQDIQYNTYVTFSRAHHDSVYLHTHTHTHTFMHA